MKTLGNSSFSKCSPSGICSSSRNAWGGEKVSPAFTAFLTMLLIHKLPASMISKALKTPIDPSAPGEVPKNSVGIMCCISGRPGAVIEKEVERKTRAAGQNRSGKFADENKEL